MTEQQQQQQPVQLVQPPAQPVQPMQPPAQPVQPVQPPAQPVQPAQPVLADTGRGGFTFIQPPAQPAQPVQNMPVVYQTIIEQQQTQIKALINQTNSLNNQITQMVQGGAQFSQPAQPVQPMQQLPGQMQAFAPDPQFPNYYDGQNPLVPFNPPSLASNQDWSLEALGKEIGKPRKEN